MVSPPGALTTLVPSTFFQGKMFRIINCMASSPPQSPPLSLAQERTQGPSLDQDLQYWHTRMESVPAPLAKVSSPSQHQTTTTHSQHRSLAKKLHLQGKSTSEIAKAIGVSKRTIERWRAQDFAPPKALMKRGRQGMLTPMIEKIILQILEQSPHTTHTELLHILTSQGAISEPVSQSTISRWLKRIGHARR